MDLKDLAGLADADHVKKLAGPLSDLLSNGGVHSVLDKLGAGGLADQVKSWIGTGDDKKPVSGDQIKSALGSGPLAELAAKAGLTPDQTSSALATMLPHAIDHMTPDGKPPAAGAKAPDASAFLARFGLKK